MEIEKIKLSNKVKLLAQSNSKTQVEVEKKNETKVYLLKNKAKLLIEEKNVDFTEELIYLAYQLVTLEIVTVSEQLKKDFKKKADNIPQSTITNFLKNNIYQYKQFKLHSFQSNLGSIKALRAEVMF